MLAIFRELKPCVLAPTRVRCELPESRQPAVQDSTTHRTWQPMKIWLTRVFSCKCAMPAAPLNHPVLKLVHPSLAGTRTSNYGFKDYLRWSRPCRDRKSTRLN